MKYLIANLKEHQSLEESVTWINKFVNILRGSMHILELLRSEQLQIILAPSTPFLMSFKSAVHEFPNICMASQDISAYPVGSYTGEVGSHALGGIVTHSIIGHSERRKYFNETNESVLLKVQNARGAGILPILCVRGSEEMASLEKGMIAYEPAAAIGTGKNYPIETVEAFKKQLQLPASIPFLYGGSADEQNMQPYLKSPQIDGLLIGAASLDASQFCAILQQV